MTSALILMFVNVFLFKISGTHIIFSALASNVLFFLPQKYINFYWLGMELILWFLTPILSVILSSIIYHLIEVYIMRKDNAIERMIVFIPLQISGTFFIMTFLLVVKYLSDEIQSQFYNTIIYINVSWPSIAWGLLWATIVSLLALVISRYYLIRKGRRS
jgi:hypothetical protein